MFTCSACFCRALQSLADGYSMPRTLLPTLHRSFGLTRRNGNSVIASMQCRSHSTYESIAKGHHRRLLRKTLEDKRSYLPEPNARRKGAGAMTKGEIKDAISRTRNRENNLVLTDSAEDAKVQMRMKQQVEIWHKDPMQLAIAVRKKLRIPDFRSALNLVRASEGVVDKNVVSWNHLIDYCMSQGDSEKAWKVYNEMKKRGHRPDAHTYTIMLRGLSANASKKNAAERAVGIYNSMFAPNSDVVPNTIHANAALNVCARARDMDSLWAIAGRLPEFGKGSPDRWTFTTILNAIREDATANVAELLERPGKGSVDGMSVLQRQELIFNEALKDARKLWVDVDYRWRRADLIVDEHLVCAIGRLILGCGSKNDFPQIFDLVERTMNFKLKERRQNVETQQLQQPEATEMAASTEGSPQQRPEADSLNDGEDDQDVKLSTNIEYTKSNTLVKAAQTSQLDSSVVYAQPSNNTLSMLMEAALGCKNMQAGKGYWHLLTTPNGPFQVKADASSIIAYLRLLRVSRSSQMALDVLSQTWPLPIAEKLYRRGTFVIAMSTCIRDKNNSAVFETADKLLLLMQEKLEEQSLRVYSQDEANSELTWKERKAKRKQGLATMDDVSFGEEEAQAELQRSNSGVESLAVDPKALKMYLDLALVTTKGWQEGLPEQPKKSDITTTTTDNIVNFERNPRQNNTIRALRRVGTFLPDIRRLAKLKVEEMEFSSMPRHKLQTNNRWQQQAVDGKFSSHVAERLDDLIELLRTIVSAYDRVITMAERFEDENLKLLDEEIIKRFRDNKRAVSGFLFRTKDEVTRAKAKRFEFAQFRNRSTSENEEEEEDDAEEDYENNEENEAFSSSSSSKVPKERKITKDLRKLYEDTDRDLNRVRSLSRRQRIERKNGIMQRMRRRDLARKDIGVVNEHLLIEERKQVERRVRQKAFRLDGQGSGGPDKERTW